MERINWEYKQYIAKGMSIAELNFAIEDCRECIKAMGNDEMKGKDSDYYRDEISIYQAEIDRRNRKGKKKA